MVHFSRILALALGLLTSGGLIAGGAGKTLKYQFKPGETYVYSVNIVGELGAATQTTKGTIQLTAKNADGLQTQLTPKVSVTTAMKQPATTGKKGFKGGPSGGPGGPFGKGGPGSKFTGPRELVIDAFGKVLRFSGETSLPLLLGTAEELVIEPLSARGENRWRVDRDLVVREGERSAAKGPPRAANETSTSAKESAQYEIAASNGPMVTIKKTYDLKTIAADGAARIQFEGVSDLAFDTQAGLLKTGEFKGTITVTDKNLTFKVPVTASFRLLDAEEVAALKKADDDKRAKALETAKAKAADKPPAADVDVAGALAELKSGNKIKMRGAAELLSTAAVDAGRRDEVAVQLASALTDNALRTTASKALKVWGTDKTVAPLLKDSSVFVKMEACKILAEIGTNECLPALQAAAADSNGSVRREAALAIKAVQGRKGLKK